jgi:3-hydroxymyristoyl/3-hydroxydecanoyl-(acyl carrier protein) dehydratase
VDDMRRESTGRIVCRLHVPTRDDTFRGHFPGLPIVPGLTLVDWAVSLAAEHFDLGTFTGMASAKFRRPLRPGEAVELTLEWQPGPSRLRYSYRLDDFECARGTLEFAHDGV